MSNQSKTDLADLKKEDYEITNNNEKSNKAQLNQDNLNKPLTENYPTSSDLTEDLSTSNNRTRSGAKDDDESITAENEAADDLG